MWLKRHLAWSAGATALCATSVLAASGLLGLSLRPGHTDILGPSAATEIPAIAPAQAEIFFSDDEAISIRLLDDASLASSPTVPTMWLRPALSEEAFTARFESPSPALAFASLDGPLAAVPFEEFDAGRATERLESAAPPPDVLAVRPPARPAQLRRKLASLDPDLAVAGLDEPIEAMRSDATAPVTESNLFGSWSDPFGRAARSAASPPPEGRPLQAGIASWYGPRFHGRRTASGEIYDQNDLTAAHPRLPFGTRVKVVNETTGRSVVVRINDRGPFTRGRVIDLSKASAQAVGLNGIGRVKIVSADE